MRQLVSNRNDIDMKYKGWVGMDSILGYEWGLVKKGWHEDTCMINITWLIEHDWSVLVRNSLKSLGGVSG